MGRRGFTLVEILVVICIIGLLAALLLPIVTNALKSAREAKAITLINQLSEGAVAYHFDHGYYPSSSRGFESRTLATALRGSETARPYFEFKEGNLDSNGDIVNPACPDETVRYADNESRFPANRRDPAVHNRSSFDLWCRNGEGEADGINNWK